MDTEKNPILKEKKKKKRLKNRVEIWKCLVLYSTIKFMFYDLGVDVVGDKNLTPITGYLV